MRLLVEFGMGTSLRRGDYTAAARRAVEDALWRNSVTLADVFGFEREAMQVRVEIAVSAPERVDREAIAALIPYGTAEVVVTQGGLDVPRPGGGTPTVIAHAALCVSFPMERA